MRQIILMLLATLSTVLVVWPQQTPLPETIIIQPQPTRFALQLGLNQIDYAPGDKLRLTIALNQDAYLYVYNITPDQRINLLFPNAYQPVNLLRAGRHTIPDRRYSLVIAPPTGFECIQVLALAAPLALDQLLPQGKFLPKQPFPLLSQEPTQFKQKIQKLIVGTVSADGWAAAWSCFNVAAKDSKALERSARLKIVSEPADADFYLNDKYVGSTPLALKLEPGRYRIRLVKENYQVWEQTIELKRDSHVTLEATMLPRTAQPGPPLSPPPPYQPPEKKPRILSTGAVAVLGFNGGLNHAQIISLGFDFSLLISENAFGGGLSFLLTGEDVPQYEDMGRPYDLGPTVVYRAGPETEFYLKLSLNVAGALGLELSGGISVQQEAHIARPWLAASATRALDVIVKPNGYKTEKIYLTGLLGLSLRTQSLSLSLGMHNRRGWVVGVGVRF